MNSHNTHSAHSTNNAPNSSSSSTALSFKIYYALPYLLVIALSSILCFGFCRFATNQVVENNIAITKSISTSVLVAEHYVSGQMKAASVAFYWYLKSNPAPKKASELYKLRDDLSVGDLSIYNAKGRAEFGTSGSLDRNPEYFAKRKKFANCDAEIEMVDAKDEIRVYPIRNQKSIADGIKSYNDILSSHWFGDIQKFLGVYIDVDELQNVLTEEMRAYGNVDNITLSTPSGVVIMKTNSKDVSRIVTESVFDDYSEKPIIRNDINSIKVSIPFGGLKNNCDTLQTDTGSDSGAANDAGQYFYVMNVTFDKTELNKQLAMIITVFAALTLCACVAIYYINKSITQSNHLADMSERAADKVTHLCNTRLGEVRRYVTKIVGDSMRTKNMNKELPEEMVELLDRAFREVDERDLITKKSKDVD